MNPTGMVASQQKSQTPVREHSFTWSKYDITNLSGTSTASEVMHKISYENIMKVITKDLYPSLGHDHDKDSDKDDYEVDYYITPEGINRIPFSDMNKNNIIYTKLSSNFNQSHPSSKSLTTCTTTDATPNNSPTRNHDMYDLRKALTEHKLNWNKYDITGIKNNVGISSIRENFKYSSIMKNAYNHQNHQNSVDYTIVPQNITRIPFSTDHCNNNNTASSSTTIDYDNLNYPSISNRSNSFSLLTSSTTTEGTPTNSPYHDDYIDEDEKNV